MKKIVFIITLAVVAIACGEKKQGKVATEKERKELTGTIKVDGSSTGFTNY